MTPTVPPRTVASIYNPDLLTKEQLIASFVVRLNKFKKLFADIQSAKMEHPEQPILIIGLRGMGKTTLLLRLSYEVENDPSLNPWLIPLVFNEEEYGITKLFKLWETIAQYLEKKNVRYTGLFDQMDKLYEQSKSDTQYEQAAFDLLLDALHKQGKKLLLFVDNFGDMFKRFGKQEKQRLREVLTTCPDLRIIAGSSVAAESFFRHDDPLFELFKIERLDGLTKEETEALLLELGKHYPGNPIKEILEKQPQRVETLRRLTGGIPRSMVLLFEIFVDDKDGDAFTDLESVLDRVTPLYKHRMDDLSTQQQEIVNAIALNWDAVSAKEIAQKTRLDSKLVSAQLKQLHQNNIVDVQATHTKNHLYLVHDRFFNIWYLMRMARKGDKNRVLWLIRFLEAWCDEEQLSKRAGTLRKALQKGVYQAKGAYDFSTALYYAEKHDLDSRYELAKHTQRFLETKDTSLHERINRSDMVFFKKAMDFLKRKDVEGAYRELMTMKDKGAQDYLVLCALCRQQGDMKQSEQHYNKAVELKAEHPERVIGDVFCDYLKEYTIAEEYYLKAANNEDGKAARYLGRLYRKHIKNRAKSEEFYRKAIESGETQAWSNLADLYRDEQKDYQKAEEFYLKASKEGYYRALLLLGWMYKSNLKDPAKAEEHYRHAIEKGETEAWRYLADLHRDEYKDYSKAEEFYLKASEEGHHEALRLLGWMHQNKLKDPAKAEEHYRQAIEKGETEAWQYLADLYRDEYKDYPKAEEFYLKASEEGHYRALLLLGWMYKSNLKDLAKAEEYYRQAIEKGETLAWSYLADLYRDEFKDYPKAEELYLKASEEGHASALRILGWMYLNKLKDLAKAEEYYRQAIEKGETLAWSYLADLYRDEYKDYAKAEEFYLKAIEEGHHSALHRLGLMYQNNLKDPAKAEGYYRQAIEKGETEAWRYLADLYCDEFKNYPKAEEFYLKASEEGHHSALRSLGWMYQSNLKDPAKAEEHYRQAIEKGETVAWSYLADLYRDEYKDYAKAEEFYLKASEEGHHSALRHLGLMYRNKLKNPVKAEEYYHQAIEKGETLAWSYLADLYCNEHKDYPKAEEFYLKASEEGHTDALQYLGWMFSKEVKDYPKAEQYLLKYMEKNKGEGADGLGHFYYECYDDVELAEKSFKEAIEKNALEAYNSLAWMYFSRKIKLKDAIEFAKKGIKVAPEEHIAHTLACILLWNNDFEESFKYFEMFNEYEDFLSSKEDWINYLLLLLAKNQYPFLYDYLTSEKAETLHLKDRFKPIWYALMYYMKDQHPTEYLRMPPELKETVQEIIAKVEQMRVDYA